VPLGHRTVAVTIEERADCRGDKQCHLTDRRTRRSKRPGDQVIFGADPLLAIESLEASHCKMATGEYSGHSAILLEAVGNNIQERPFRDRRALGRLG
jgi:hypothetical protein